MYNICNDGLTLCIPFNTQVDVPIRIHNGDTAIVTFTGVGYDKRVMGETMQLTADQLETSGVPSKTFSCVTYLRTSHFIKNKINSWTLA